jgi:hypothetical protein
MIMTDKEYIEAKDLDDFRNEIMDRFLSLCDYNDYNKLTLLRIGETIDEIYGKYVSKPLSVLTNADRIRAMSDEELRNLLCTHSDCALCRWDEPQGCTLTEWLKTDCGDGMIMTDNEFVDKYQNALSDLCGVDYVYMQGDPAVDTIVELIRLAVEQKTEIERLADHNKQLRYDVKKIRAEARKEFAERLNNELSLIKKECRKFLDNDGVFAIDKARKKVDNLVKEMTGELT